MICPICGSKDVIESEVEIFEIGNLDQINPGFDPFSFLDILKVPVNAYEKARLAINGKKRYYCREGKHYFEV